MARSSFSTGRTGADGNYEPKVDRDPFYRTLGIFNGVFKKKFKIVADSENATDCKSNIYVNFGETLFSRIVGFSRESDKPNKSFYTLACGHEWEGNAGHPLDGSKSGACWKCGSHQAYLGFEHEWQHIIFKSDIPAQALFCEGYVEQLRQIAPNVDEVALSKFLKMVVNAFDDIRCNSLWEKIYPGSADQIWQRWQRLTRELQRKVDENFLCFIFAVAFNVPTDPGGQFESLRPVVEWAVSKVKYRGFANMLTQVRVVIEHSMAMLLSRMPQKPPPAPQLPPPSPAQDANDRQVPFIPGSDGPSDDVSGNNSAGSQNDGMAQGQDPSAGGKIGGQEHGSAAPVQGSPSSQVPHASVGAGGSPDTDGALRILFSGAEPLEGEKHLDADFVDMQEARKSNSTRAMIAKALSDDINDLRDIDQRMPTGIPDKDMQSTIDFMTTAIAEGSTDSQLTNDAKARVTIIDVPAKGIDDTAAVVLKPETKIYIARMRAAFFKAMGRQKARRSSSGAQIDVQAYIQYKLDRQDPDVFIDDVVQQGFSYSIVCDMSGSMAGTFPQVAQAAEMLRESLDFPFVRGDVWGFRGGEDLPDLKGKPGDVWLYRYSQQVRGYLGKGFARTYRGRQEFPVRCGGITPMNTAINVTAAHQHRCVSEGMAKRMFLLTDGSPLQTRITGGEISTGALMKYVAEEIKKARNRGIQVYTMVIGKHAIKETDCFKMFGPRKFWRRVSSEGVGKELADLVIDNFQKYLSHRG